MLKKNKKNTKEFNKRKKNVYDNNYVINVILKIHLTWKILFVIHIVQTNKTQKVSYKLYMVLKNGPDQRVQPGTGVTTGSASP